MKRFALIFAILLAVPAYCPAAECSAQSAVVMDSASGIVLYEKNAYDCRAVASTTKIMTALLALESGMLDSVVKITGDMLDGCEGSSLGLSEGDTITLYDLTVGMMLVSGNDCANAAAYYIGGGIVEFADMMNNRAAEIGMTSTVFVTPSGLDEGDHHSTAYDMALLACAAVKNDAFCKICSMKSAQITVSGKAITVYNHNKLLSYDDDFIGVKTGYTEKAGRCLVSAKKYKESVIICVTLSAPDDWNDHMSLINESEAKYTEQKIDMTVDIPAVGGDKESVCCKISGSALAVGGSDIEVKLYYYPFVYSPVKKGDIVGNAVVMQNNQIIKRLPIEADEDVNYVKQHEKEV